MYKIKKQVRNLGETLTGYVKDQGLKPLEQEAILQFKRKIQIAQGNHTEGGKRHNQVTHQRRTIDIPLRGGRETQK